MSDGVNKNRKRKQTTITVSPETADKLGQILGNSRKMSPAMTNLVEWLSKQDHDMYPFLFDNMSPESEAKLLEIITRRAHERAKLSAPQWPEILTDEQMAYLNENTGLDDLAIRMQEIIKQINDRKMRYAASKSNQK